MQFLSSDAESCSLGGGEREGVTFHFGITASPVLLNLLSFEDWKYGLGFRKSLPTELIH